MSESANNSESIEPIMQLPTKIQKLNQSAEQAYKKSKEIPLPKNQDIDIAEFKIDKKQSIPDGLPGFADS